MPLKRALIDVPLSTGLAQKSDYHSTPQDGAIAMTDCVRLKNGAITKRFGSYALANTIPQLSSDTVRRAVRGQSYQGSALLFDGSALYGYSDSEGSFNLADITPEAVALDRVGVAGNIAPLLGYDVATAPGFPLCMAWTSPITAGTGVYTAVLDPDSGAVLQAQYLVDSSGNGQLPRVILCGSIFVLAWVTGSGSTTLTLATLDPSNLTAGWVNVTSFTTVINHGTGNAFDLCNVVGDPTRFDLAYAKVASGNNVHLDIVNASTLATIASYGPNGGDVDTTFLNFACAATSGGQHWMTYLATSGANDLRAFAVADVPSPTPTSAALVDTFTYPVGGQLAIAQTSATSVMILFSYTASAPAPARTVGSQTVPQSYWMQTSTYSFSSAAAHAKKGTFTGLVLTSKPAAITSNLDPVWYVMGYVPSANQGTQVLLALDSLTTNTNPGRLVATVAPRLAKQLVGLYNAGPTTDQVGAWVLPQLVQLPAMATRLGGSSNSWGTAIEVDASPTTATLALQGFDFNSEQLYFGATLGTELGLNAGAPFTFDGSYVAEMGFLYYPETVSAAASNSGGSLPVGTTYTYVPVYEWTDTAGNVERSATGIPITAPVIPYAGGAASLAFSVGTLTVTGLTGMSSSLDGKFSLQFTGAATSGANAVFPIAGTSGTTQAGSFCSSSFAGNDANNGSISWTLVQGGYQASITVHSDGTAHVTGLSGMTSGMVGQAIQIGNASYPGGEPANGENAGLWPIAQVISATEIVITNSKAATDANNSEIQWYLPSQGTGSVTLQVPTLGATYRQRKGGAVVNTTSVGSPNTPPVQIVLYRNTNASTGSGFVPGTTYYRCTDPLLQLPTPNDITAPFVSITDVLADYQIDTNATLYTTGGTLDNFCPSSARIEVTHQNRWLLAGCDDPSEIWASKEYIAGEVPGFNEALNIYATGRVTALASLDDKLVIFVQRGSQYGIEYVSGLGPFDSGASPWPEPQPVPSDVGAVDQRSIVVGPFGCLFKSNVGGPTGSGGIFLLSRDLQVTYVSGPVEDVIAANPVVTSAVLHPNNGRVYFTVAPTDALVSGGSGSRLVWDYVQGTWSQDTLWDFDTSSKGIAARCAWVASGVQAVPGSGFTLPSAPLYHWATSTGRVYRETMGQGPFAYVDSATTGQRAWIAKSHTSAWIKPTMSGFSRFWRVQVQGDQQDPGGLQMTLTFDYASATYYAESAAWTDTQIATFDRFPQVDVQMVPGNQKAKAIQVTLTEAAPLGTYQTGKGVDWATVSFEVGVGSRGYPNLPAGQKA